MDGTFPNHHPDPSKPANLQDLIRCVKTTDVEVGLAFDGDADRCIAVDENGKITALRPGTVTVALHRTRKKLREHLKREGFFDE